MRALLAAVLLAVAAPALADETSGTVALYDAAANRLAFTDRTVWLLPADVVLPIDVGTGDRLRIVYLSAADNGWTKILSVERVAPKPGAGG